MSSQVPNTLDIEADPEKSSGIDSTVSTTYELPISDAPTLNTFEGLDESSPISYHFLTYETTLPAPSTCVAAHSDEPPLEPDLSSYESPFLWPAYRKNYTIWISCIATCLTAYTAGSYSPPADQMAQEWDVSKVAVLVGITTFCVGFAVAPMVLAPFSEINGRYPVFAGAGVVYVICQIGCAVTQSYPGMLVARFLVGCGSSVFSTMVGGVVSDLYHAKERNAPMALYSCFVLIGTGLGPLVSGFLAQNIGWRWVFWLQVITNGILIIVVIVFFRETRGSILLSRKARRLNQWYEERESAGFYGHEMPVGDEPKEFQSQRIRWRVKSDEERESLHKMISVSVYRPFHLLLTEPVVFSFSLWVAFAWAILYLTFGSIPLVYSSTYSFDTQQSGSVFAAMSIGSVIIYILSIHQESILSRLVAKAVSRAQLPAHTRSNHQHESTKRYFSLASLDLHCPEARLYFACVESVLLPIGLFWFGWTCNTSTHWIVPTLAVGCATMGIYSVYLATFNYLADTYHRYASSALAAQSFCRNMLGGVFPLVTGAMFQNLGYAKASSLLGALAAALTIVPWVLVFWGPQIRARSKFAREIM